MKNPIALERDLKPAERSRSTAPTNHSASRPRSQGRPTGVQDEMGHGGPSPRPSVQAAMLLTLLVAALLNGLAWWLLNPSHAAPEVGPKVTGLAYNAFQRWDDPIAQRLPETAQIDADLQQLAQWTQRLRTYSASEFPDLPALAEKHGLRLSLGVWLDRREEANQREIAAAIEAGNRHRAIERVIAGNETQLHHQLKPAQLYAVLDRLRRALPVPVSTAEPWHVWMAQPQLVNHVDFITVHLLPYWEGVPVQGAVDEALRRYQALRERYPYKPVVIGEIGWPSAGEAVRQARPSPAAQAVFIREFLARAQAMHLDYYLMEAIDQPWKRATEGRVGAHWGWLDAHREPKFSLSGPIHQDPRWHERALRAVLIGAGLGALLLVCLPTLRHRARLLLALGAQLLASIAVLVLCAPLADYLDPWQALLALLAFPALALMAGIALVQLIEFAEMYWRRSPRPATATERVIRNTDPGTPDTAPLVSLHLPCCNEPPAMVIATLESLIALDWPALEILVIDNNTRDPARWRPVREHLRRRQAELGERGPRLRFIRLPRWPGFKAGALNVALARSDPRAQWIGVVDADYLVRPDWLHEMAAHFDDPQVAVLQSPQAHREWADRPLGRMMNWEYEGFFRIGMHHRDARNAIIQHGTMCLVRARALRAAGAWSPDCVCEDTELGLRLLREGWTLRYLDQVTGTGLVPADFAAYRRQRERWAQGAMQILRRHAGALLGRSPLSMGQRYHFIAGWLPWLGDALHLGMSLLAIAWTVAMLIAPAHLGPPGALALLPLLAVLLPRMLLAPLLYRRHVGCTLGDLLGAALAGLALSHGIARGVIAGLSGRPGVFEVTRRATGASRPASASSGWTAQVREELGLLSALLGAAFAFVLRIDAWEGAQLAWLGVLALLALPYGAALACAGIGTTAQQKRTAAVPIAISRRPTD